MKKFFFVLLIFALSTTCKFRKEFDHQYFSIGISKGKLDNKEIDEASGLAASIANKGTFWTHNDSGDSARIFLINDRGQCKATVLLRGIKSRDCEDITVGNDPKNGINYVYLADIGDNNGKYEYKYIYRFEEPSVDLSKGPATIVIKETDTIKFKLPDGKRDTEALMIDPRTSDLYIFSKREKNKVNLYVLPYPQSTSEILTADFVMHIPILQIVAADISADGTEVLVKNYDNVFYWKKEVNESIYELFSRAPAHLPYAVEPQGEAIAFDRAGEGYYTLSEESDQKKPHLMFYKRKD